jgi:predicted site-specific integrase-resolvase
MLVIKACKYQGFNSPEDLAKDVLEIITVFSARLYGSRSHKNQKLIDGVKQVVDSLDD